MLNVNNSFAAVTTGVVSKMPVVAQVINRNITTVLACNNHDVCYLLLPLIYLKAFLTSKTKLFLDYEFIVYYE